MHTHSHIEHADEQFPADTTGLDFATDPETVEIADGGAFDLRIAPVKKQLGDATVRMLAYNGSVPGPTLKVAQGSEVTVNVENRGDLQATVHWHGLRPAVYVGALVVAVGALAATLIPRRERPARQPIPVPAAA